MPRGADPRSGELGKTAQENDSRLEGRITRAAGRHTTTEQNRPALDELKISTADGDIRFGTPRASGEIEAVAHKILKATQLTPAACPICLTSDANSREHVPPMSLGGGPLVMTCQRCNNEAGSRLEPDLLDWYEHALSKTSFASESILGQRRGQGSSSGKLQRALRD